MEIDGTRDESLVNPNLILTKQNCTTASDKKPGTKQSPKTAGWSSSHG
jgi:hypothetical protein